MSDARDQLQRLGALMKAFKSNDASSLEVCNFARDIDFDALASARPEALCIPEGWKLVPLEPTEAMLEAGDESGDWGPPGYDDHQNGPAGPEHCYRAMLTAAPSVPSPLRRSQEEK